MVKRFCRKLEGLAYKSQPTPDLPRIRVSEEPPFTHTCVDFAGPLYPTTKTNGVVIKAYVSFYLCFDSRGTFRTYSGTKYKFIPSSIPQVRESKRYASDTHLQ